MGLQYRKSTSLGNGARLNVSKRGLSVSQRVGPLSMSSRGNMSLRLAPGISYRAKKGEAGWVALAVLTVMLLVWLAKVALIGLVYLVQALVWAGRWAWFSSVALIERRRARQTETAS